MSYEVYRKTTLGNTLQETLDELMQSQQINDQLANKVFKAFDKSMAEALSSRVKNRFTFKGKLNTYRFCDNVWTLLFNEVNFECQQEKIRANKVKFVACDGKSMENHP